MSYCRWSSDDFSCDVYVYADVSGGWTTHVATRRIVGDVPHVEFPANAEAVPEYLEAEKQRRAFMETAKHRDIGLPHDGATFNDATPGECSQTLQMLKAIGYNVPQYVIETLDDEERESWLETPHG